MRAAVSRCPLSKRYQITATNDKLMQQEQSYTPKKTRIGNTLFEWGKRTYVMGIINATPDSFSGDGVGADIDAALRQALRFQAEGADIVDVGGESTRPTAVYGKAAPVSKAEELRRVIPVIEALASELSIPISVDTYKAAVAKRAIEAGAAMVNDVWGLRRDPDMARAIADAGAAAALMHNRTHTRYTNFVPDVIGALRQMAEDAQAAGICRENIILDPGIGFGKTAEHNLEIMRRLREFRALGAPLLLGVSRKSVIGYALRLPVEERMEGTAAAVALCIAGGADIVRVHDVREMARVARMSDAIARGGRAANAE